MLFRSAITLIYLFYALSANAQTGETDSLLAITKKGSINERVNALNKLCGQLMYDKPGEAKVYVKQSIRLADSAGYKLGLGDAYNMIGVVYDISGKYDSSIFYYEKAYAIFEEIKNLKGRGSSSNNLGLIYWNMADYDKALTYFFEALSDFEQVKNERFQSNALNNIGLVRRPGALHRLRAQRSP